MNNGTQSKSDVIAAVDAAIANLDPGLQGTLQLSPVPSGVYQAKEGDWIVPVASGASSAMHKSYELHRTLSQMQQQVESRLHTFVTITLDH